MINNNYIPYSSEILSILFFQPYHISLSKSQHTVCVIAIKNFVVLTDIYVNQV